MFAWFREEMRSLCGACGRSRRQSRWALLAETFGRSPAAKQRRSERHFSLLEQLHRKR